MHRERHDGSMRRCNSGCCHCHPRRHVRDEKALNMIVVIVSDCIDLAGVALLGTFEGSVALLATNVASADENPLDILHFPITRVHTRGLTQTFSLAFAFAFGRA